MTQQDRSTSVNPGGYNGLVKPLGAQRKTVGGTVSVRVTGNRGGKKEGGYLRIPSSSSSHFCANADREEEW